LVLSGSVSLGGFAMNDKPYPDEFNINLPDEYLIAIGKVNVQWGMLETIVDLAIGTLGGFQLYDPRSAIMTAHMTWPLKMDVLESLVTALAVDHQHLSPKFQISKPLLKKAQEGRNRIIHGQWGYEDGKASKLRATARGKLKTSIDPITVSEIEGIAKDVGRAGVAILKLVTNK
jgi:hypothetical protein